MKTILRGSKVLDFTSSDGKAIKGTKLFVSFASNGTIGEETATFFVKSEMTLPKLVVGNAYVADFSNTGKLIGLYEAQASVQSPAFAFNVKAGREASYGLYHKSDIRSDFQFALSYTNWQKEVA